MVVGEVREDIYSLKFILFTGQLSFLHVEIQMMLDSFKLWLNFIS